MKCVALVMLLAAAFTADAGDPKGRLSNEEWKKKRAAEDAAAAVPSKMAAVDKAVEMMESLQQKVLAEGEEEAESYNKFACFCKTGQNDKTKSIKEGKDEKASLIAAINKLSKGRKANDKTIKDTEDDIKDLNDDMDDEEKKNAKAVKKYNAEAADLSGAIDSINGAMKALKAGKPSLLQLRSASNAVQEAVAMADALGLDTANAGAFLQQPDVEMENYKHHSGGVIDTIEKLLNEFRGKKEKCDSTEVARVQKHDMQMQEWTDQVAAKTVKLQNTEKARDDKTEEIEEKNQELTTVSSTLLDDQTYLKNLYSMCKKRADTWDQRTKVRADELSAITAATTLVKGAVAEKTSSGTVRLAQRAVSVRLTEAMVHDEDSMEAVEAAAEEKDEQPSTPLAFLQKRLVSAHQNLDEPGNRVVLKISELLRSRGQRAGSTLLTSLASTITTEKPKGMEKITTLIEELIKRLQAEAANEATQKGWCDKSRAKANQKRVATTGTIDELNDNMAKLEADSNLLQEELDTLSDEIADLKDAKKKANSMRKTEKSENEATIQEAKEGKGIISSAIMILEDFYKKAKSGKSLVQIKTQGPADDAPDAGFEGGEDYKGNQSGGGSVLGMLDIIKSDFVRTIKVVTKAETEAAQDHTQFLDETNTSLKAKDAAEKAKTKEKDGLDSTLDKNKQSLEKATDLLVNTIEELLELKKACVDTAMSYEERVARREEEIAALQKALCILKAYAENGANEGPYDMCSGD